jgi:hypothetical protein
MTVGFFAFFGLTVTLLRQAAPLQIPQHSAQFTAICLTTITSPANMKFGTAIAAADELQQKKGPPILQLTGSGSKIKLICGIPAWNTEFSTPKARSSNFGLFLLVRPQENAFNQMGTESDGNK